ncbi:MAG TPA: TPM domain-containing protein [Bacteroidota bacterium]|nr:TPM domain-containing protein [Bacteroidota bacterium]
MNRFRFGILFLLLAIGASAAAADTKIYKVEQRVSDFTNTLSFQEWQALEKMLKEFEDSTSNQLVVLMIPSLEGSDIEEYANKTFSENKIGQAKKNNGVLLLIAKDDHKMRIEVGPGLEGVLTDALSSQIIRNEITPQFRAGNYFAGVVSGVDAIMRATAGEYKAEQKDKAPAISGGLIFIAVIFFFTVFMPLMGGRRRYIVGSGGHRYYSGWGYGGGWPGSFGSGSSFGSGGGFGGFSGGGGFSAGGGASGSW